MNALQGFAVTYSITTEESSMAGDYAESGFLDINGTPVAANIGETTPGVHMGFREAFELFNQERDWTHVESDSYPISAQFPPRWFTDSGEIAFASGECREVSLHLPESVTGSSAMRIARLVRCYGAESGK
jgi:hypothetical protein